MTIIAPPKPAQPTAPEASSSSSNQLNISTTSSTSINPAIIANAATATRSQRSIQSLPSGIREATIDASGQVVATIPLHGNEALGNLRISYRGSDFQSDPSDPFASTLNNTTRIDSKDRYTVEKITQDGKTFLRVTLANPVEELKLFINGRPITMNQAQIKVTLEAQQKQKEDAAREAAKQAREQAEKQAQEQRAAAERAALAQEALKEAQRQQELKRAQDVGRIQGRLENMLEGVQLDSRQDTLGQERSDLSNILAVTRSSDAHAIEDARKINILLQQQGISGAKVEAFGNQLVFNADSIRNSGTDAFFEKFKIIAPEVQKILLTTPSATPTAEPTAAPTEAPAATSAAPAESTPAAVPPAPPATSDSPTPSPAAATTPTTPATSLDNIQKLRELVDSNQLAMPARTGVAALPEKTFTLGRSLTGFTDPAGLRRIVDGSVHGYTFVRTFGRNTEPQALHVVASENPPPLEKAVLVAYAAHTGSDNAVRFNQESKLDPPVIVNNWSYDRSEVRSDGSVLLHPQYGSHPIVIIPLKDNDTITWSSITVEKDAQGKISRVADPDVQNADELRGALTPVSTTISTPVTSSAPVVTQTYNYYQILDYRNKDKAISILSNVGDKAKLIAAFNNEGEIMSLLGGIQNEAAKREVVKAFIGEDIYNLLSDFRGEVRWGSLSYDEAAKQLRELEKKDDERISLARIGWGALYQTDTGKNLYQALANQL